MTGEQATPSTSVYVGDVIVVHTADGNEEDDVTRVIIHNTTKGIWLVETAHHGRVVVMSAGHGGAR
jgi:hypothetical protein